MRKSVALTSRSEFPTRRRHLVRVTYPLVRTAQMGKAAASVSAHITTRPCSSSCVNPTSQDGNTASFRAEVKREALESCFARNFRSQRAMADQERTAASSRSAKMCTVIKVSASMQRIIFHALRSDRSASHREAATRQPLARPSRLYLETAVGVAARHWPASDGVSRHGGRVPDLSTDVPDSVTPVRRRQSDVSYVPVVDSLNTVQDRR